MMGTGVFRPEVDDPELCNTDNTTSWELSYLASRHFHPTVRTLAGYVVAGSSSKGVGSTLTRM
jgi:nucleolar complex protein 3